MRWNPPAAVLFDLDDTLFAHTESVSAGVLARRRSDGLPEADDAAELSRWLSLEEHHYHRYLRGEVDFLEQRRARARRFVAPLGIDLARDEDADAWFASYLSEYRRSWRPYADAHPALDLLEQRLPGVRFGIVTNGELDFQLEKLEALGLRSRIPHVIASGEFGAAKPDPAIFAHACERVGVTPAEAVYVGDRFETDAIGATSAGLLGVWLRRGPGSAAATSLAAAQGIDVVASLTELPALLARADRASGNRG